MSCSDLLDVTPKDKITDVSYWKKAEDFKLVANGFYTFLEAMGPKDLNADVATSWTRDTESNGTYVPSEESSVWNDSYSQLRTVNYLLSQAEHYEKQDEIKQYIAEAKFFRAYIYYRLLVTFGGVPLISKPLDIDSDELMAPRNSREEVVDFILEDLDAAIPSLPLESEISSSEKGRVSKGAAFAFKARVSLFEATWQKFRDGDTKNYNSLFDLAILSAKEVMMSKQYELFTSLGDSSYKYMFILENQKSNPGNYIKKDNREYILVNKYEFGIRTYSFSHFLMQQYLPTRKIADMYLSKNGLPIDHVENNLYRGKDVSGAEFLDRDLRMINTFRVPGKRYYCYGSMARDYSNPNAPGIGIFESMPGAGYQVHKFMTERNVSTSDEGADFPVIRYPEVLLIYAEALFERYGQISDDDLNKSINILRKRAKIEPLTNAFVSRYGLSMRDEIRRERTVELFMEGYRLIDLKRWKIAVDELKKPLLGIKYRGTSVEEEHPDPDKKYLIDNEGYIVLESSEDRHFSDKHYLQPLPLKQLFLNPNLEQNPGW